MSVNSGVTETLLDTEATEELMPANSLIFNPLPADNPIAAFVTCHL